MSEAQLVDDIRTLKGRDHHIASIARKRGLKVFRQGAAWRVVGHGVDILAARLSSLSEDDLLPSHNGK